MTEPLHAWTIQTSECWKAFQRAGTLRADGRRVWPEHRSAYQWLISQMAKRLDSYHGGFPVWFWHSPKPDLRARAHLPTGTRGVRLELRIARERALLLDFETWHCVLNGWPLPLTWREDREIERRPLSRCEIQKTWERVFDLPALRRSTLWGGASRVQGVVEYLLLDEVVGVDRFVAR